MFDSLLCTQWPSLKSICLCDGYHMASSIILHTVKDNVFLIFFLVKIIDRKTGKCFLNYQINFRILRFRIVCCWWRIQSRTERVFNSWISRRWLQWSRSSGYSHPNWDHHIGDQDPECSWRERSTYPWTDISGTEEIWISWGNCRGLSLNSTLFTTILDKIDEKFRPPPPPP